MYRKGTILNALIQFYITRHRVNCCYTNFFASVIVSCVSCGENLTLSFQKREKTERIIQKNVQLQKPNFRTFLPHSSFFLW
jgi:hypothetical protein